MNQKEYKYIAYCDGWDNELHIFAASTIEGLMNKIDDWYEETQGYTPYQSHLIDDTICISDYQFLIYTRGDHNESITR